MESLAGEYFRPYAKGIVRYPFHAVSRIILWEGKGLCTTWRASKINEDFLYKFIDKQGKTAETGVAEF